MCKKYGTLQNLSAVLLCGAFALFLLLFPSGVSAATINAASCSQTNVQSAINSASTGDTVAVPAGTCTWSGVSIPNTKKLTLKGAGKSATTITGMPRIGSSGSRITGFTFLVNGVTGISGYGFRFDHNKVVSSQWLDCIKVRDYAPTITQMPYGLIDNNEFINCRVNMEGTPYIYGDDTGTNQHRLWALPLNFGGPETVYIENNTFELTYSGNFNAIDANYGGSFVARYNTVYDGLFLETHSSQEGGNRSGKSFEVYGNIIDLRNNLSQTGGYSERWRGGTGLHFLNSYVGTWGNPGIPLDNVRSYASAGYGGGLCDGASLWDGNQNSSGWPCRDQIGRGPDNPQWVLSPAGAYTQPSVPTYLWGNRNGGNNYPAFVIGWSSSHIQANRDFYDYNAAFNGSSGVGCGTLANRPASCTTGVGYWATSQSCTDLSGRVGHTATTAISGTLYKCTATNTWTSYYTPLVYPHPAAGASDTTAPTAPTNLQANAISSSQIDLTWIASTDNVGVTGYRVERCSGSSCTNFAQVGTPTGTSYTDTGLTAATTYRYRVRAVDAAGNLSDYSGIASATTQSTSASCHTITGTSNMPATTDYATPYDLFNSGALLLGAECAGSTINFTAGDGTPQRYIYKRGYTWYAGAWQPFTWNGGTNHSDDWLVQDASVTLPASNYNLAGNNYVLMYSCEWRGAQGWKCGCRDTACADKHWSLQIFRQ